MCACLHTSSTCPMPFFFSPASRRVFPRRNAATAASSRTVPWSVLILLLFLHALFRRETTRADIERLTKVLEQERVNRQRKEQYSALAKRIHAYPSREDTQAEIGRLNDEISTLKQESDAVQGQLELRSKRFAGFMHALHDVQQLLKETEEAEAAPAAE